MEAPQQSAPRTAPVVVEVWSDIACPWCYIGKRRFAEALESFEHRDSVEVIWRAYQLAPETPVGAGIAEIDALVQQKGMPADQVRAMFASVSAAAADAGLTLDFDTTIAANTFDAHRLVHIARRVGGAEAAEAVIDRLFRAHFREGVAVDDREQLVALAVGEGSWGGEGSGGIVGLDAESVRRALDGDDAADEVRADIEQARALGVTGVPFFAANRAIGVSGAQPAAVFHQLLSEAFDQTVEQASAPAPTADADDSCADGSCSV